MKLTGSLKGAKGRGGGGGEVEPAPAGIHGAAQQAPGVVISYVHRVGSIPL